MKLDIAKAFGGTFSFLFGRLADVLLISWLPIIIQLAAYFLLMPGYVRGTASLATVTEPEEMAAAWAQAAPGFVMLGLFMAISFLASVAMVVGLTRLALTGEKPKTPFYIGWGRDEWRLAGGWLMFALIIVGLVIVLQGGGFLLRGMLGRGPIAAMITLVVSLVLFIAIFTVCIRLSLLAPATLATSKIALGDAWERTDDDFWNFLGFWLLFFLIFAVVYAVLYFTVILPPGYFEAFQGMDPRDRSTMTEAMRKANDLMIKSYDMTDIGNVVRQTIAALYNPLVCILTSIAGAMAWKQVTDPAEQYQEF